MRDFHKALKVVLLCIWNHVMRKIRLNPVAVARTILTNLNNQPPLSKDEMERVRVALENSGVPNAASRYAATQGKIYLTAITEN